MLEIGVLGELRVTHDGRPVPLPPSKKTRALLAYLAVVDRPQRRERLCDMLWEIPDDPRGALRWSLSKIRQIVNLDGGDRLEAKRDTVRLRTEGMSVDLHQTAGLAAADLDRLDLDVLEEAAGAFRGTFLEDLYLPNCPEYEAWRTSYANETEILRLRILRTLVRRLADQPERALAHAHVLRALSPEDAALAREVDSLASAVRASVASPAGDDARKTGVAGPTRQQEIGFCRGSDGVRIAYATCGEGPPIVRAAHWMSHLKFDWDSPVWRHWIDGLSESNTLIRYDERCCGLSDRGAADVSFEAMVSDLETVVETVGLKRFALLGVSQSCAVSVAYAARHPERVSHLVLYGGYARGWRKRGNAREIATREAFAVLMREGWGQEHPLFLQLFSTQFIPDATPEQMTWFNELQLETVLPADAYRLQGCFGEIDVSPLLHRIRVPTLVIHASGDRVSPATEAHALAAGIPGARFVELDSANHILLRDEPAFARFLAEVRSFISMPVQPPAPAEAEQTRKPVSVLAVEIVSPLLAFEGVDPETVVTLLEPLVAAAADTVERCGGIVAGRDMTGLVAVFGTGGSGDGHAFEACRTAIAVKATVERAAAGAARVRAAVDTGQAVLRCRGPGAEHEISGAPMRTARQLARALRRGIVAATARTREAAGEAIETRALSRADYPTHARDQSIFEVVGTS